MKRLVENKHEHGQVLSELKNAIRWKYAFAEQKENSSQVIAYRMEIETLLTMPQVG